MEMLAINLSSRSKITCDIYSKTGQDTVLLYKIDWQETMRPFSKLNKFKHLQKFKHQWNKQKIISYHKVNIPGRCFWLQIFWPWQIKFSVMCVYALMFYIICSLTYFHIKICVCVKQKISYFNYSLTHIILIVKTITWLYH